VVTEIGAISESELLAGDHYCAILTVPNENTVPQSGGR
jgi:hypothetical protein